MPCPQKVCVCIQYEVRCIITMSPEGLCILFLCSEFYVLQLNNKTYTFSAKWFISKSLKPLRMTFSLLENRIHKIMFLIALNCITIRSYTSQLIKSQRLHWLLQRNAFHVNLKLVCSYEIISFL